MKTSALKSLVQRPLASHSSSSVEVDAAQPAGLQIMSLPWTVTQHLRIQPPFLQLHRLLQLVLRRAASSHCAVKATLKDTYKKIAAIHALLAVECASREQDSQSCVAACA